MLLKQIIICIKNERMTTHIFQEGKLQPLSLKGEENIPYKNDAITIRAFAEEIFDYFLVNDAQSIEVLLLHDKLPTVEVVQMLNIFEKSPNVQVLKISSLLISYIIYKRWLSKNEHTALIMLDEQTYRIQRKGLSFQLQAVRAASDKIVTTESLIRYTTSFMGVHI